MEAFIEKIKNYEENNFFKTIVLNDFVFEDNKLKNGTFEYHLNDLSKAMFFERMGLRCPTMLSEAFSTESLKETSTKLINGLLNASEPIITKAYINTDSDLLAIHSKNYKPLFYSALYEAFESKLEAQYHNVEFLKGIVNDDFMAIDFAIKDDSVCKPYRYFFGNGGSFYKSYLVARLVSSNIGTSGANIYPLFVYKTTASAQEMMIPLCTKTSLKHEGEASIEKFNKNCNYLFNLISSTSDELKKLEDIKIKYPTHCIINIADKVGISAKEITPIAETVSYVLNGYDTTAKDLYVYLSTVIGKANSEKEKLDMSEKVSKAVKILLKNSSDVDIPKIKWKRLKVVCDEEQDFIPDDYYQEKLAV